MLIVFHELLEMFIVLFHFFYTKGEGLVITEILEYQHAKANQTRRSRCQLSVVFLMWTKLTAESGRPLRSLIKRDDEVVVRA
jgi:hypothetical protein